MTTYRTQEELEDAAKTALEDFERCLDAAADTVRSFEYEIEVRWPPHKPPGGLNGHGAVYAYYWPERGAFLKVGKAGAKSSQRYQYHHYGPNAGSTLFKDLKKECDILGIPCEEKRLKSWMYAHLARADVLLAPGYDPQVLALLEAFLHLRWRPRYEGKRTY